MLALVLLKASSEAAIVVDAAVNMSTVFGQSGATLSAPTGFMSRAAFEDGWHNVLLTWDEQSYSHRFEVSALGDGTGFPFARS